MNESTDADRSPLPYVVPMAGFLVLTALEGYLPKSEGQAFSPWYPLGYAVKVAVVAALAWTCRSAWRDLRPPPDLKTVGLATLLGFAVAALWVGIDGYYPELPFLGKRQAFDPTSLSPAGRYGFLAIRMFGLAALVPLIEELFWRSFVMRWVIAPDFSRVPIGRVTPAALLVTSVCFGLEHPEWLPGVITGLIWAWLLWRTKSVAACVVSHVVANLALGIYVIATGDWKYW
jgi:CAAX prenyl protease-like protein